MAADTSDTTVNVTGSTSATPPRHSRSRETLTNSAHGSEVDDPGKRYPAKATNSASSDDNGELRKRDSAVVASPEKTGDPYAHLAPEEAAILKRQVDTPNIKVGVAMLYRYATRVDMILIAIGTFSSVASGCLLPLMTVIFGSLQSTLSGAANGTSEGNAFASQLTTLVLYFVYLAIGMFVTTYASTAIFIYTGEHISGKIREKYLEACMKQNIVSHKHTLGLWATHASTASSPVWASAIVRG